jgi:peptide deformylase
VSDGGTGPEPPTQVRVLGVPVQGYPDPAPEALRGTPRRITMVGEDVLHRRCGEVTELGTPELSALIDDMFASMYAAEGVGLAANQIGVGLRVFVYDCPDDAGVRHVGHIVNPVLDPPDGDGPSGPSHTGADPRAVLGPSGPSHTGADPRAVLGPGIDDGGEGCLSVPGPIRDVPRPAWARVRGVDRDGRPLVLEGSGYFARCLAHETDHLDGHLYIERLSRRERAATLAEMETMIEDVMAQRAVRTAELAALAGQ